MIHCNWEFRAMMDKVKDDLGVRMNFTNALDHVPQRQREITGLSRNEYGRHITDCRIKHYQDNLSGIWCRLKQVS
jgi:hypothetical protein